MIFPKKLSKQWIERLNRTVIVDPHPFVINLKESKGMWIKTIDDDLLFDWTGLYGSRLIGYGHPKMLAPKYIEKLIYAANNKMANPDFLTTECVEYYELIYSLAPLCMKNDKLEVYVVNSGAEAVENMMKYLINLHHRKEKSKNLAPHTHRFIYFDNAFHGRTLFALNITHLENDPIITKDFKGIIPGNIQIPFPAYDPSISSEENISIMNQSLTILDRMINQHQDEIVGIILEPIQGAGGHRIALPEFYREVSKLCKKYNVLWGIDEVQTAGGQTGKIFCIDHYDLPRPPDAVATAKKFGNGVVYMLNTMEDKGILDSTWGGSLSDMVRFSQEWAIVLEEKLLDQVEKKSKQLILGLTSLQKKYPTLIKNIRGLGLYQGFTLIDPKNKKILIDHALEKENLLLLGAGKDSIRFRPPLDVSLEEINLLITKLQNCFFAITHQEN